MSKTAIIIPARYGSSRLEGKPLIEVEGKPIIQWVYEKAEQAKLADMIIVATDDERIFNAVEKFGGNVEMTSTEHKCGSDRIKAVSYTHLTEVLNADVFATGHYADIRCVDGVYKLYPAKDEHKDQLYFPVSYTHLDVYKRQVIY